MSLHSSSSWTQAITSLLPRWPARTTFLIVPSEEPFDKEEDTDSSLGGHIRAAPVKSNASPRNYLPSRTTTLYRLLPILAIPALLVLIYFLSTTPNTDTFQSLSTLVPGSIGFHFKISVPSLISAAGISNQNTQDNNTRKAIVFASYLEQDISWFPEIPKDWEIYRYILDDPNPDPADGLPVPRDQGREAMAYLTFIIDNYENLPNFTVFHHGHRRAWHQPEATPDKLRALNLTALKEESYINFRCTLDPGCTDDTFIDVADPRDGEQRVQAFMLPKFWNTMFGNESVWNLGPPPDVLSAPCCAQFAVTREAILARPWNFWANYREPLVHDFDDLVELWGEGTSSYTVGICYEKLWHMVFGKEAVYCPTENYCRGTLFSDAIICDKYTGQYEKSFGWEHIECIQKWQDSW